MKLKDWLLPYQIQWLNNPSDRGICRKSRRTGMTLTHALKMILRAGEGADQNIISLREDSSKLVLRDCHWWLEWLADNGYLDLQTWDVQMTRITNLATGATITALPAVPRLLRGRKGDVFIDEAAWIPDLDKMLVAAKPLQLWGGKISLISSPFPVPNLFTELCDSGEWSVQEIDIYRATSDGLYRRICQMNDQPCPSEQEEQSWIAGLLADAGTSASHEYLCQEGQELNGWITEQSRLMSIPIVQLNKDSAFGTWQFEQPHSIGIDVGGTGSITSIAIAGYDGLLGMLELTGLKQTEMVPIILSLINPSTVALAIDTNGLGQGLYDQLSEKVDRSILISQPNNSTWFRTHCLNYLNAVYSGTFSVISDPVFLADHRGASVTKGTVNLARVGDRHCDTVPAAAMAYQHKPTEKTRDIWMM